MAKEKKMGHFKQDPMITEVVVEGQWGVWPYAELEGKSDEEQESIIKGWRKHVLDDFIERLAEEGFIDIDVSHPLGDETNVRVCANMYVKKKGAEIKGGELHWVKD